MALPDSASCRYYVIGLAACADRRSRLVRRLVHHGLMDRTTFLDAIPVASPVIDWFESGVATGDKRSNRGEHACFLTHLKALRAFVDSGASSGIILEDDAMLRNDFSSRLESIHPWMDLPLIMLTYMTSTWTGISKIHPTVAPSNHTSSEMFTITPTVFGAVGYWIRRDYAQTCLDRLDRPLRFISDPFVTSELITRLSGGGFVSPPLVIEEAVYSTLRQGNDLQVHRRYFSHFGFDNYSAGDDHDVTKLWVELGSGCPNVPVIHPPLQPSCRPNPGTFQIQIVAIVVGLEMDSGPTCSSSIYSWLRHHDIPIVAIPHVESTSPIVVWYSRQSMVSSEVRARRLSMLGGLRLGRSMNQPSHYLVIYSNQADPESIQASIQDRLASSWIEAPVGVEMLDWPTMLVSASQARCLLRHLDRPGRI